MTSAPPSGTSEEISPTRLKLAKWSIFTFGLILVTALADYISFIVGPNLASAGKLFGRGELLIVSVTVLLAASADLIFDCFVRGRGRIYHGVVLGFSLLMCLPLAVAYGSARATSFQFESLPNKTLAAVAEQEVLAQYRATASIVVLVVAIALGGLGVYLSEKR